MTDIDAIRQRVQAATEGPWEHGGNDGLVWPPRVGDPVSGSTETADAEFIAHARQDIPALLAELDAARPVIDAAKAWAVLYGNTAPRYHDAATALHEAVAALEAAQERANCPDCRAEQAGAS